MNPLIDESTRRKAADIVDNIWDEFILGEVSDLFLCRYRWNPSDVWASQDHWRRVAEHCVAQEKSLISAFEILLHLDADQYLDDAQRLVDDWENRGGYDAYYFHRLIAHFPDGHPTKEKYLGDSSFFDIFEFDLYANSAREALITANDKRFMEKVGRELDSRLSGSTIDDADIEDSLYLFYDLGANVQNFVSKRLFLRLKDWFLRGWENDCRYRSHARMNVCEADRSLWVADKIGHHSWLFGWQDVLEELTQSQLYWDLVFSEDLHHDHENLNLLAWSSHFVNPALVERASELMQSRDQRIDGAISIVRLDSII